MAIEFPAGFVPPCGHTAAFNLWKVMTTKWFARKQLEETMEAEGQRFLKTKDERDFFTLIEKKLEQQGFKVLETLPPDCNGRKRSNTAFSFRSVSHTAC